MAKATKLNNAKNHINDEFYTLRKDIENELQYYTDYFKDKIVYCNCDDPKHSEFYKYFKNNFKKLHLRKLICTHKSEEPYEIKIENSHITKIFLQDGDFRNKECLNLLKKCDVVVTNPPFSLSKELILLLIEHQKDFLLIGNINNMSSKDILPLIKDRKIWTGYTHPKEFLQPDGTIKKFGNICWFTNIDTGKRHEKLPLTQRYYDEKGCPLPDVEEKYPHYDNFDAINIDKVKNIPIDYYPCWYKCEKKCQNENCKNYCNGLMGCPISFLEKFNDEFEIIGLDRFVTTLGADTLWRLTINGKICYARVIVRRKSDL